MSYFSAQNIPFGVKASNLASVANFSSTLEDSYILIIANNCNEAVQNENQYDTVYNSFDNAALFGVNLINQTATRQEAYIGIKRNDIAHKIAKFNSDSINLDVNTIINGNMLPCINSNYDLGSFDSKWKNLYLSESISASDVYANFYGDGNNIVNLNLAPYSTSELSEGSNLYFTDDRFYSNVASLTLDYIANGTSNQFIVNNEYPSNLVVNGMLTVDSIYIKSFTNLEEYGNISISYNVDVESTSVVPEGNNLYFTYERVKKVIDSSNSMLSTSELKEGSNLYYTPSRVGVIVEASNLNVSNYVIDTAASLRVNTTNAINNLSFLLSRDISSASNAISNRITNLNADMIADGNSHRFIINNNYEDDMFVHGILSASNLNIIGTTTTINTASYTTENLQIVSRAVDGPTLLISQTGDGINNLLTAEYNDAEVMVIKSSGNVGIGVSDPTTKLHVDGIVAASSFAGDGSTLTNVNLSDRNTTLLTEGTNLYYTAARVGVIVSSSNVQTSNYINNTSNELANTIQTTSNIISERITSLNTVSGDSTSNYINNTSNELANTIQITSNIISHRITTLNADMIVDGTSHRFIINNNYEDDMFVHGTLSASNLNIIGTTTTINTASYTTENLQIVSKAVDGPALLISQTGDGINNVLTAEYNDAELMVIKSSGNVGIGVSDPTTKLQVDGTVTASFFAGDGSALTNVNLNDRTTTSLAEGENLYYTAQRVGVIVSSSNVETSNYINNTSNELANTIQTTSNIISTHITYTNSAMSNYINNTSNELANTIQTTSNIISERITSLNTVSGDSTSNYINNTSNELANTIQTTSNIISERITSLNTVSGDSTSNYINNTSNELANTIQTTSNIISHRITNLNADMIADGTSHRFIINNNYHDDIFVHGTLSANNLNILGTTTTINTASYTTENLQIVSIAVDGPALLISQTGDGTNNVLTAEYNDDELMVIKSSGNVGIGVSDPTTKLQIDGTVSASLFAGDGSTLTNVNLNDRTTTLLTEGTNLYYTAARVGVIVLSSNVETSNYINNTSNELANTIQATSNIISERITSLNTVSGDSTSNYINNTSNELANTIQVTSNIISERITSLNTVSGDSTSNYINNTSNELANTIQATSNIISERITNTDLSISNYINNTSNELANTIQDTSNTISHRISNLNADRIADGNLHKFIINDTYDANLQVNGTLTASNLNIIGTSTIINTSTYTTENLLISTDGTDGPALAIDVNGTTDIILITSNDITTFIINEQNNVGIGVSTPSEKLEISGSVKADYFKGNGIYLHNVNLSDKSTSELAEGSNLYYTNERVSLLIDSSNIGLSNDIIGFINNLNFNENTSNQLVDYIRTKQNIINGAASSITNYDLISNRVVVSSLTGKITESSITTTELGYLAGTSNLIQKQIDDIILRNTDDILEGISNKYIIDNIYDSDLHVQGSLYASNLYILGNATTINTTTYETENLYINNTNADGPSLILAQNTDMYDVMQVYNLDVPAFIIANDNNVGIGISEPTEALHVVGTVKADVFFGSGIHLYNVNINDKSTSELLEGSNLYYTHERVAHQIYNSNIDFSNILINDIQQLLQSTSNNIIQYIPNAVSESSNILLSYMKYLHLDAITNTLYYSSLTSNALIGNILNTSNNIIQYVNELDTTIRYVANTSNDIMNNVFSTSNSIINQLQNMNADQIYNGNMHKFIVNDTIDTLFVDGTLTTSNLYVIGTTTIINTTTYQSENIYISTDKQDGPAMNIDVLGDNTTDIINISSNNSTIFSIDYLGNIHGNGEYLYDVNLHDKTTSELKEGSNLYFTYDRVSDIVDASNYILSEYINTKQNIITGAASSITEYNLLQNRVLISSITGKVDYSSITINELLYLTGASNNIQKQIDNIVSNPITNADQLYDGNSNRYIINGTYDTDLTVLGTLTASNLNIIGTTTNINSVSYKTENVQIITSAQDGPALLISQSGDGLNNLFTATFNNKDVMVITSSGNVGIGITDPEQKLVLDGIMKATLYQGNGSNLYNINLSDRTTSLLEEGSNLYYTTERVGVIVSASNVETSNYINNTSNELANMLQNTSNIISSRMTDTNVETSNYINNTSNELANMLQNTSNILSHRITNLSADMIADGISHRFIVNNEYDTDMFIHGTLSTSNLNIIGTTTTINTASYTTENLHIVTTAVDGPALLISQTGDGINNLLTAEYNDTELMVINSTGSMIIYGSVNASQFVGEGNKIYNVNLNDRNTTMLTEGSNLYYTTERVSEIVNASNIDIMAYINYSDLSLSNYIHNTAIALNEIDMGLTHYIFNTSNAIIEKILNLNTDIIKQGTSNLYYKEQYFDESLSTKSLDNIKQGISNLYITNDTYNNDLTINGGISVEYLIIDGIMFSASSNAIQSHSILRNTDMLPEGTSNKYIINNIYNDDLTVHGTLTVDNIIVHNNISVINNSIYNSECLNIANYTDNPSINILQIGEGDIFQIYDNYTPVFMMNNEGFFGNVLQPNYNVDITGIINATYFRGSGILMSNINLNDKSTSELSEGSNMYFTDQRVYDILYGSNYMVSNQFIPFLANIYSNVVDSLDNALETIACINLDKVIQGSNNKYIVNNIYNDSLLVNGTLTVKNIHIIDIESDYYSEIYHSNLYNPSCSVSEHLNERRLNVSNIVLGILDNYDILSTSVNTGSTSELAEGSNLYFTESRVLDIIAPIQSSITAIYSNLDDISDELYCINLDNVIQGSNNKYIVNNIYNDSLLINGILTVRNIHIIDVDEQFYSDQYNAHLYQPVNSISGNSLVSSLNVSNIVSGMMTEYDELYDNLSYALTTETILLSNKISSTGQKIISTSNIQANEINLLKNKINTLSSNLNIALERIYTLETKMT
jgi:DNA-binding ferritin-like protein